MSYLKKYINFPILFYIFFIAIYIYLPLSNMLLLLLLLFSVFFIIRDKSFSVTNIDKAVLIIFSLFFLHLFIIGIVYNEPLSEIDNYSRAFLFLPFYLACRSEEFSLSTFSNTITVISMLAIVSFLLFGELSPQNRYSGSSNVSITFGNMLMSLIVFQAIFMLLNRGASRINNLIKLASVILLVYTWTLTGTRGSLIGLVLVFFVFLIFMKGLSNIKILLLLLVPMMFVFISNPVKDRIINSINISESYVVEIKDVSIIERMFLYESSVDIIKNNIITGIGQSNFETYIDNVDKPFEYNFYAFHAHNDFLDLWAKYGILSFILLTMIYVLSFYIFFIRISENKGDLWPFLGIAHLLLSLGYMMTQTIFAHHQSTTTFLIFLFLFLSQTNKLIHQK